METEKKTYTAPQLKKIYAAPRLTKHGSVAKLTGSALPPHSINGNNINPPAISGAIIPGGKPRLLRQLSADDQQKQKLVNQLQNRSTKDQPKLVNQQQQQLHNPPPQKKQDDPPQQNTSTPSPQQPASGGHGGH